MHLNVPSSWALGTSLYLSGKSLLKIKALFKVFFLFNIALILITNEFFQILSKNQSLHPPSGDCGI